MEWKLAGHTSSGCEVIPAGPGITFKSMNLSPTFNSIAVEVLFDNDDNKNATATLEFKKAGDTDWKKGLDLWRVDPADAATPIDNLGRAFYGSALLLEHNTPYEVRVTISDPDGGGSVLPVQSVTTRNDNIPNADTLVPNRFVAVNGNDSWDGTSETFVSGTKGPWKTLQKAVVSAPSDAVLFRSDPVTMFNPAACGQPQLQLKPNFQQLMITEML